MQIKSADNRILQEQLQNKVYSVIRTWLFMSTVMYFLDEPWHQYMPYNAFVIYL